MGKRQSETAWMKARIAGESEVHLPSVTKEAVAHFGGDDAYVRAFFAEHAYQRFYTMLTQICASTRVLSVTHEDEATDEPGEAREERPKWLSRLEHAGGRYIRLADMDKKALEAAAAERRQRGETELHLSGLWEKLALKLPAGRTVKEVFSDEEIDRWARNLKVQIKVNIPVPTKLRPTTPEAAD